MKSFARKLLSRRPSIHAESELTFAPADARWLLGVLASVYRKPLKAKAEDADISEAEMLAQVAEQGFEVASLSVADWLDEAITPVDARLLAVGEQGVFFILGRKDGEVLLVDKGADRPRSMATAEFRATLDGARLYVIASNEDSSPEAYGWRWFLKAFFARKKVIRDALITSLVIQLVALAFPLATQAIVDKVITNQAESTLIALGIGIALFAIFNALMSWLRQKLLLRLANVVDADLSVKVMAHLFRLPLRYFEAGPPGC